MGLRVTGYRQYFPPTFSFSSSLGLGPGVRGFRGSSGAYRIRKRKPEKGPLVPPSLGMESKEHIKKMYAYRQGKGAISKIVLLTKLCEVLGIGIK